MDNLKLHYLDKASITEFFPDGKSFTKSIKELVNEEMNYQINKRLKRLQDERTGKDNIENDKKKQNKEEKLKSFLKTREESLRSMAKQIDQLKHLLSSIETIPQGPSMTDKQPQTFQQDKYRIFHVENLEASKEHQNLLKETNEFLFSAKSQSLQKINTKISTALKEFKELSERENEKIKTLKNLRKFYTFRDHEYNSGEKLHQYLGIQSRSFYENPRLKIAHSLSGLSTSVPQEVVNVELHLQDKTIDIDEDMLIQQAKDTKNGQNNINLSLMSDRLYYNHSYAVEEMNPSLLQKLKLWQENTTNFILFSEIATRSKNLGSIRDLLSIFTKNNVELKFGEKSSTIKLSLNQLEIPANPIKINLKLIASWVLKISEGDHMLPNLRVCFQFLQNYYVVKKKFWEWSNQTKYGFFEEYLPSTLSVHLEAQMLSQKNIDPRDDVTRLQYLPSLPKKFAPYKVFVHLLEDKIYFKTDKLKSGLAEEMTVAQFEQQFDKVMSKELSV